MAVNFILFRAMYAENTEYETIHKLLRFDLKCAKILSILSKMNLCGNGLCYST